MLWRQAEWSSLLELQSDRPPNRVATLRLAEVVVFDGVGPQQSAWMIDQALLQLSGLREYLRAVMEHDYPQVNPHVMAETSRRALYVRAQLLCTLSVLAERKLLNTEEREQLRAKIGSGPEDWVPLRVLDAFANRPDASIELRLPFPVGCWQPWSGNVTAARSMLLKLAEAARVANTHKIDLALLEQRLKYSHQAVRDAAQGGKGKGLHVLERRLSVLVRRVRDLIAMNVDADREAKSQRLARQVIFLSCTVRRVAEIEASRLVDNGPRRNITAPLGQQVRFAGAALRADAPIWVPGSRQQMDFTLEELEDGVLAAQSDVLVAA